MTVTNPIKFILDYQTSDITSYASRFVLFSTETGTGQVVTHEQAEELLADQGESCFVTKAAAFTMECVSCE